MYWHFHLDDQGFAPLASLFKQIAIMEMNHIEQLAERILYLKGDVDMGPVGPVERITEPDAIVARAADLEESAVALYNRSALACSENADSGSKQVFEALVNDEEGHFDEFDKQLDNIKRFGPNYLALQSFGAGTASDTPAED
jgi:bacterioferritin